MRDERAVFWWAADKARRKSMAKGLVTEEQGYQALAREQPSGLPIFAGAAAWLVSRRSDILLPRALRHRKISGNASSPHFVIGSHMG